MDLVEEVRTVRSWIGAVIMSNIEVISNPQFLGVGTLHAQIEILMPLMEKLEAVEEFLKKESVEAK